VALPGVSDYERRQIDSVLHARPRSVARGTALVLLPVGEPFERMHDVAITPALMTSGLNRSFVRRAFDHVSPLAGVLEAVMTAEMIVADLTILNPSVMYVVGLAHGQGRCPLIIAEQGLELPFDLHLPRCVRYARSDPGLVELREELTRVIRVFVASVRAGGK
jgi:hypothetical protein